MVEECGGVILLCFTRPSHPLHTIKYLNTKSYCEIINFFPETGLAKRILSVFSPPHLSFHTSAQLVALIHL